MPVDNAGNTTVSARNLGTLSATAQTFTDWVGDTDTNDVYRFTIGSTSNLRVNLTGMSADADVYVYSADGTTLLGRSSNIGNVNETVDIGNIAPGTCYVRVLPLSGNTNYGLSLAAVPIVPADSASNTLATARNIGILTATTQTFKDWIGNTDTNDWYRFTLSSTSNLHLNLTGLSADANVVVYSADGTTVRGSGNNVGNVNEAINITGLAAGTYYARVYPGVTSANTNYNLAISAQVADYAGNTVATARTITTALGAIAQTFTDWVGTEDSNDYYRFTLGSAGNLQLNLTDMGADADVYVYASNGTTLLGRSSNAGSANETIRINNLAAGNYYALVNAFNGDTTNYGLSLAALPTPMPDFAGNTIATARNLGALTTTAQTFRDGIGSADSNDYYRFTLNSGSGLQLNLTGLSADANVLVYAANGTTVVGTGANTGATNETVAINNLAAGTYYARVYPGVTTANTNYTLALSAPPIDSAGNTIATARNLGTLTTASHTYSDWVGSVDSNDYYRFILNATSDLRLNLTGLGADANLVVYTSNGTTVAGSGLNTGTTSEVVSINNLVAGTYYARVYPGVTTANTNYTLAIASTIADYAGNTIDAALNIGTLGATSQTFTDRVNSVDTNDYYRFVLGSTSDVTVGLNGLSANADVVVYDSDRTRIWGRGLNSSNTNETLDINRLGAGVYYVRVYPGVASANTNYNLTLTAPGLSNVDDGGNRTNPRNIGPLPLSTLLFRDQVSYSSDSDYYMFTTERTTTFSASIQNQFWNGVSAQLLNSDYSAVAGATNSAMNFATLNAGTYYLYVRKNNGGSGLAYTLSLTGAIPGGSTGNMLLGTTGNDTLTGSTGSDTLLGDVGNDTLTGAAGSDMFRFFAAENYGLDTITDFQSGTDKIQVLSPNFANLTVGTLATDRLVAAGTTLTTTNPVFIYNSTTGALSFDSDGAGNADALQFATLTGTRTLVASDIQVIAA